MKKNSATFAFLIAVVLLMIAMISEITLVFTVNSQQADETGSSRLEIVSRELEQTVNDARSKAMRFAVTAQNDIDDRAKLEKLVREYKNEIRPETDGVCYNVYIAGNGWYIIPDFDAPADYDVNERSWYKGALRSGGRAYVTDPYIDAATGDICYTVSVMLADGETFCGNNEQQQIYVSLQAFKAVGFAVKLWKKCPNTEAYSHLLKEATVPCT